MERVIGAATAMIAFASAAFASGQAARVGVGDKLCSGLDPEPISPLLFRSRHGLRIKSGAQNWEWQKKEAAGVAGRRL